MKIKILFVMFLFSFLFSEPIDITSKNYNEVIGQGIVVVEYWAGWNEANKVNDIEKLRNVKIGRINVDSNPELQLKNSVIVVPTIIFYDNGEEYKRLQGDLSFTLNVTLKELQKIVDEILLSKF